MIIGLTGQIGSGKSTAAQVLKERGAVIVDADLIGREVVEESSALRSKLAKVFGPSILDRRGRLIRKRLAELAFASRTGRDRLNALVHPYLLKELRRRVKIAVRAHAMVVVDAALLLHWRMDREVDFVLVIHAGREIRLARLAARGIDRRDALARERAQLSYREFQRRADRVILNNGTKQDLIRKIESLLDKLPPQTH